MDRPDVSHLYVDPRSWPRGVKPFDDGLSCVIFRDESGMYRMQLERNGHPIRPSFHDDRTVFGTAFTHSSAKRVGRRLLRRYRRGENYISTQNETIR